MFSDDNVQLLGPIPSPHKRPCIMCVLCNQPPRST